MKTTKIGFTLLALLAMITGAKAQTFFNENFDGSDYSNGAALPGGYGQINYGGWVGPNNSTVTNSNSLSSPNSLLIADTIAQGMLGTTNAGPTPATGAVDFHFALDATSTAPLGVVRLFDSANNQLTELSVGYQQGGELSLDTDTGFINITTLTANTWYNVDMLAPANPGASQYTINVYDSTDTTLLGTATGNFYSPSTAGNYSFFQLQNISGSQSIDFDNVSVTEVSVPEPAPIAGISLLAAAMLLFRWRVLKRATV
jgi:hypothetical protein